MATGSIPPIGSLTPTDFNDPLPSDPEKTASDHSPEHDSGNNLWNSPSESTSIENENAVSAYGWPEGSPSSSAGTQSARAPRPLPVPPGLTETSPGSGIYSGTSPMAPHVQVEGKLLYHWDVNNALNTLYQSPSGKKLVDEFKAPMDNQGNVLKIHQTQQGSTTSPQFNGAQEELHGELFGQDRKNKLQEFVNKQSDGQSGEGTSSTIHWNSNQSLKLNEAGKPTEVVNDPAKSHLVLAHELVHAHGHVTGTSLSGDGMGVIPSTKAGEEELRATGISMENFLGKRRPEYDAPISENTIREELNEPKRTQYHFEKQ